MVNNCKRYNAHLENYEKNLKLIWITCWVIRTGWKFKKVLDIGPSLENQNKKEKAPRKYTNIY